MGLLHLVRHGESIWNRDAIVQGQAGPGLSPLGHEQVRRLGPWLAQEAQDAAFVCSDLVRCRETAAPYAQHVGRRPVLDESLRERHFGEWQGLERASLRDRYPSLWARFTHREDVLDEVGGESTPTLLERVVPALRRYAREAPVTVVVTHGGPIWHGVHALLGIDEPVLGPVSNASVTTVDVGDDGSARLIGWNAVGHLPPGERTSWRRPPPDTADEVDGDGSDRRGPDEGPMHAAGMHRSDGVT